MDEDGKTTKRMPINSIIQLVDGSVSFLRNWSANRYWIPDFSRDLNGLAQVINMLSDLSNNSLDTGKELIFMKESHFYCCYENGLGAQASLPAIQYVFSLSCVSVAHDNCSGKNAESMRSNLAHWKRAGFALLILSSECLLP